jgi:hypothetical protein
MSTLEFYIERAAECRQEAAGAKLANVRERCLRSALVWDGMADQLRVMEAYRIDDAARKAALKQNSVTRNATRWRID